ncbi:MAG: hypothetical protein ACKPKO_37370, partial [Candidatus Fonsibacter sp.]
YISSIILSKTVIFLSTKKEYVKRCANRTTRIDWRTYGTPLRCHESRRLRDATGSGRFNY